VASMAHEVRQPLTAITMNAAAGRRFLNQTPPEIDTARKLFEGTMDAALRANEVFEGFRNLFGRGEQVHQAVDMNLVALEAIQLVRRELDDHDITTRTELTTELPIVWGHTGQLREVILNLVQNAIEAIATTTNRPRVISLVTTRCGSDLIAISIQDTGPGIHPQKVTTIFDPFVSTKAKGTGLGLAICKMIVERHGGDLLAASDADSGARFEVTLPTKKAVA
jgi:signal transduction histidine kinase